MIPVAYTFDMITTNHPQNEADTRVEIPFKPDHYQFIFFTNKGKDGVRVRRIYKGKNIYKVHEKAMVEAFIDYPEAHGFACHSPQCD